MMHEPTVQTKLAHFPLLRQPALEQEEEADRVNLSTVQREPAVQLACRLGDDSCAGAHAESLNRPAIQTAPDTMLRLQRQYGNRFVQRVVAILRQGQGEADVTPDVEQTIQSARGGGQPLDTTVRAQMEPAFGANFSGVRVHTNSQADSLNQSLSARAFTTGQDIFFKEGEYRPGTSSGRELLAHELTHVVQQNGDQVQTKLTVGAPGDRYEQEADQVARTIVQREQQPIQKEEEEKNLVQAKSEVGQLQRRVSSDYDTIRGNLSYGLFDWAIRDYEAREVIQLLEILSDQDLIDTYFRMTADGLWSRLTSNAPRDQQSALATLQQRIDRLTQVTELSAADRELIRNICIFFFPDNPPSAINNEVAQLALQMVVAAKDQCSELMDIVPRPPSNPGLFWLLRQVGEPVWRRIRREGSIYVACRNTVARNFRSAYQIAQISSEP